jgi:hypothetical protein
LLPEKIGAWPVVAVLIFPPASVVGEFAPAVDCVVCVGFDVELLLVKPLPDIYFFPFNKNFQTKKIAAAANKTCMTVKPLLPPTP